MRGKAVPLMLLSLGGVFLLTARVMAGPMVIETHSFHVDPTPTKWTQSFDVPQYDPANYGGQALTQVDIHLRVATTGDVTFNGSNTSVDKGSGGAKVSLSGPGGINEVVGAVEEFAPPAIQLVDGQPVQIPLNGDETDWFQFNSAAVLGASTGAGTVPYDLMGDGLLMLEISGGNINVNQSTTASAWLTVDYLVIPEPSTLTLMVLGGLALCGCWIRARG